MRLPWRRKPANTGTVTQSSPAATTSLQTTNSTAHDSAPPQTLSRPLGPVTPHTYVAVPAPSTAVRPASPSPSVPAPKHDQRLHHGGATPADKKDYWKMAAEKLQEEDPSVKDMIAAVQRAAAAGGDDNFATQLLKSTERSREVLESKRWKVHVGEKQVVLRKQLDRLVQVATVLKDVASAAASLDPLHAGLPLAGFCVLMQIVTNDSDQYAAMVAGVEEVVTIVARYQHVEEIYRHRSATSLKGEFEQQLVSLYRHIMRYQIAAATYYQRNTLERYVRALPKLDDLAEVTAAVRQGDSACAKITQLFDSADAMERHQEVVSRLDQFQQLLARSSDSSTARVNVHWTVQRSTNSHFVGRDEIVNDLKTVIQDALQVTTPSQQTRVVVTGIGGQGKSEVCLQVAHQCRSWFWGVFWIDVGSTLLAEEAFVDLGRTLGMPTSNWEDARQALGALQHPWMLVLDNADEVRVDYSRYFPPNAHGVVLLTSRNTECARHATSKHFALDELTDLAARDLLLHATGATAGHSSAPGLLSMQDLNHNASAVATLLQSHPLALIQAAAYVARGHCTLAEYPQVYHAQRKRLLQYYSAQAQSRYGDVYATFEASASILQAGVNEVCADALSLLPVLAAFERTQLPLALFEAAWKGVQVVRACANVDDDQLALRSWHVDRLPPWLSNAITRWDSFRLIEAVSELRALSLVTMVSQEGRMSVSMHPLVHAWARDRQHENGQHVSWVVAGCVVALSSNDDLWQTQARQCQPHIEALLSWDMGQMFASDSPAMISGILLRCGLLLDRMRADQSLQKMMKEWFGHLGLDLTTVGEQWIEAYELAGKTALNCGETQQAVLLLEQVTDLRQRMLAETNPKRLASRHELGRAYHANGNTPEAVSTLEHVVRVRQQTLADDHNDRLESQLELAEVCRANGQVDKAVTLLEEVMTVRKRTLAETHPDRLASQHNLALAYQANGRVVEAVTLLEEVVAIRKRTLAKTHPDRLASQAVLASAYQANGRVAEAVTLLEEVVAIWKRTLAETHPDRLVSQHNLARVYQANGRVAEAVTLLEEVVAIEKRTLAETHPDRLTSQHNLASAYQANGRVVEAVTLLEEVVAIRKRTLAETHPDRLASQHNLASAYQANGRVAEAVTLLEEVVAIRKRTLAETHPDRLASQHILATVYWAVGCHLDAVQSLQQVVNVNRRVFPETHPQRQNAEAWLRLFEDNL